MKKQILSEQFKRMQKLAGLNENENWNEIAEMVRPLIIPIDACCANDPTLAFY